MRTTITLDPDVEELLRRSMRERGLSFKQAVNEAVRRGLGAGGRRRGQAAGTPTFGMGFDPSVAWDKALALSAELEDDELARRLLTRP